MKKIVILFLTIPFFSFTTLRIEKTNDFIGKWVGADETGEIGYIIFDKEGYATFGMDGQVFGGKDFVFKGTRGKMTYEVNESTVPIQVDFTITKLETGDQKKILGIAKFEDADTMDFAINFSEENRPAEFNDENTITLNRLK